MARAEPKYHTVLPFTLDEHHLKSHKRAKTETLDHLTKFLAEVIGTGMLMLAGCGCLVQWGPVANSALQNVLGFTMSIMFIIQVFGHVSGAHLNPTITISAYLLNLIDLFTAGYYVVAQFVGAFLGFGVLKLIIPTSIFNRPDDNIGVCSTVVHPELTTFQGLCYEFIASSFLVLAFCAVCDPRNSNKADSTPLRFGFIIFALCLFCGSATGASFNPPRTFVPSLFNNNWNNHWIYWVGPLSASVFATLVYKTIFWRQEEEQTKVIEVKDFKECDEECAKAGECDVLPGKIFAEC